MSLIRKECPSALKKHASRPITGKVWIDSPLLVVAGYSKAQSQMQDPIKTVESMLKRTTAQVAALGCASIHFVFDGPSRAEKAQTRATRTAAQQSRTSKLFGNPLMHDLQLAEKVLESFNTSKRFLTTTTFDPEAEFVASPTMQQTQTLAQSFPDLRTVNKAAKAWVDSARSTVPIVRHTALHDSEEYICAHAAQEDLILSSDSDVLAFGAPWVVQHFASDKETWIELDDLLSQLKMDLTQFRWLCILLGNDFNTRVKGCGPVHSLNQIRNTPSFDIEQYATNQIRDDEKRNAWLQDVRATFQIFSLALYSS